MNENEVVCYILNQNHSLEIKVNNMMMTAAVTRLNSFFMAEERTIAFGLMAASEPRKEESKCISF